MTDQRPRAPVAHIRFASDADVPEMARLFGALGYPISPDALAARFRAFSVAGELALVASQEGDSPGGQLLAVAALHVTPVLHRDGPVGRLTALVVDPDARGTGIGRRMVDAAEAWAAERGCVMMEVTSNRRRTDAHAFYERIGYDSTSLRFGKVLAPKGGRP